jgi:hypothetical protein
LNSRRGDAADRMFDRFHRYQPDGFFCQIMKETFYFSHDSNARNDVKIIKLRRQLGMEGYGIYWCLIEMLRDAPGNKLPINSIDDIAFSINCSKEKVDAVIRGYDLFMILDDAFFSDRLIRSMESYKQLKAAKSKAGKVGMEKRWNQKVEPNKMVL